MKPFESSDDRFFLSNCCHCFCRRCSLVDEKCPVCGISGASGFASIEINRSLDHVPQSVSRVFDGTKQVAELRPQTLLKQWNPPFLPLKLQSFVLLNSKFQNSHRKSAIQYLKDANTRLKSRELELQRLTLHSRQ